LAGVLQVGVPLDRALERLALRQLVRRLGSEHALRAPLAVVGAAVLARLEEAGAQAGLGLFRLDQRVAGADAARDARVPLLELVPVVAGLREEQPGAVLEEPVVQALHVPVLLRDLALVLRPQVGAVELPPLARRLEQRAD